MRPRAVEQVSAVVGWVHGRSRLWRAARRSLQSIAVDSTASALMAAEPSAHASVQTATTARSSEWVRWTGGARRRDPRTRHARASTMCHCELPADTTRSRGAVRTRNGTGHAAAGWAVNRQRPFRSICPVSRSHSRRSRGPPTRFSRWSWSNGHAAPDEREAAAPVSTRSVHRVRAALTRVASDAASCRGAGVGGRRMGTRTVAPLARRAALIAIDRGR